MTDPDSLVKNKSYLALNASLPADFVDDSRSKVVIDSKIYRKNSSCSRLYCDDENTIHNIFEEVNELPTASELCNVFIVSDTNVVGVTV